jgi:hypothetical protein
MLTTLHMHMHTTDAEANAYSRYANANMNTADWGWNMDGQSNQQLCWRCVVSRGQITLRCRSLSATVHHWDRWGTFAGIDTHILMADMEISPMLMLGTLLTNSAASEAWGCGVCAAVFPVGTLTWLCSRALLLDNVLVRVLVTACASRLWLLPCCCRADVLQCVRGFDGPCANCD